MAAQQLQRLGLMLVLLWQHPSCHQLQLLAFSSPCCCVLMLLAGEQRGLQGRLQGFLRWQQVLQVSQSQLQRLNLLHEKHHSWLAGLGHGRWRQAAAVGDSFCCLQLQLCPRFPGQLLPPKSAQQNAASIGHLKRHGMSVLHGGP